MVCIVTSKVNRHHLYCSVEQTFNSTYLYTRQQIVSSYFLTGERIKKCLKNVFVTLHSIISSEIKFICVHVGASTSKQSLLIRFRFMVFNATFYNISVISWMQVSFIGGGNQSAQRKSPTCRKSLTNFITYISPELDLNSQR